MKSNAITNWLLGIFSAIILMSVRNVGTDINNLQAEMLYLRTTYDIEVPEMRNDIEENKKNIRINKERFQLPNLIARKEDD